MLETFGMARRNTGNCLWLKSAQVGHDYHDFVFARFARWRGRFFLAESWGIYMDVNNLKMTKLR
jgi:hypothetical protein